MKRIKCISATKKIIFDLNYLFSDYEFELITEDSIICENDIILICERERNVTIEEKLAKIGLKEHIGYFYIKDFLKKLNYLTDNNVSKKIALWGAGNIAKNCVAEWDTIYPNIQISCLIDTYANESGASDYKGISIVSPDKINDWENYFIVVAVNEKYEEIERQLIDFGLIREKNYINYRVVMNDISDSAMKTIFDNTYRKSICKAPFRIANISCESVFPCTCAYSMSSIGIPKYQSIEKIWISAMARVIRCSVLNGTYSFCSKKFCEIYDLNAAEIQGGEPSYSVEYESGYKPETVVLSLDFTCNLHCPSCRKTVKVADCEQRTMMSSCADKVMNSLAKDVRRVWVAGDGECFFSTIYREILVDERMKNRNQISILSNGTLFSKQNFECYLSTYKDIDVMISIDGVKKETVEKLRRGAKYELLMDNFKYLGELRKQGRIRRLCISMTLQKENVYELPDMIKFCEDNYVDQLNVIKMVNYFYSEDDFDEISVVENDGKIKDKYSAVFKDNVVNHPIVHWMGFSSAFHNKEGQTFFLYDDSEV